MNTVWTDDRVDLLKEHWGKGLSASQIARKIPGMTKNAVLGKAHRLGLPGTVRQKPVTPQAVVPSARRASPPRSKSTPTADHSWRSDGTSKPPRPIKVTPPPPDLSFRPSLVGLSVACACHWPLLELPIIAGDVEQRFCGAAQAPNANGWPYCATHLEKARSAYQPSALKQPKGWMVAA